MASWIDLACAVKTGDLEAVRRLVEEDGVDVNMHQSEYGGGKSVLHLAVRRGHSAVVQFLLENNADVNAVDQNGLTPLHCDVAHGDGIEILRLLIRHKADINARERRGRKTPLLYALTYYRGPEVFRLLLDHKADVTATDKDGSTALHLAVSYAAKAEVIQCLIDHKAAVNAADNLGRTPLHNFYMERRASPLAPLVSMLLSHDADVHAVDAHLQTPLHLLVARNSIEAVRVLLDHIRPNHGPASIESVLMCVDDEGKLPFRNARSLAMVRVLLEQPLLDNDRVVPQVCHAMLFAKDGRGRSLLGWQQQQGDDSPLRKYLESYAGLTLTVRKTVHTALPCCCEHRATKRPRHHHATVPFNPKLNDFQRRIATAFLNKWDQSFRRQAGTTTADDVEHEDDLHAMLPTDVKYVIMAFLSPADIMKI